MPVASIPAAAFRPLSRRRQDPENKIVHVQSRTCRPPAHAQELICFNGRHDGITLEAVGGVVLTAGDPAIADSKSPSFPAVVNTVVDFGNGISTKTVLRGFRFTGANNYPTGTGEHCLTRALDEVKTVARRFGLNYRPEEGFVTHTLHTLVIDRRGRLAADFEGNQFTARQLGDYVDSLMAGK